MLNKFFLCIGKGVILKRRFFLFSAVVFLPIFTSFTLIYLKSEKLKKTQKNFNFICQKASKTKWQREAKKTFLKKFKKKDSFCLSSLNCKEGEIKTLKNMISHPAFIHSKNLKERLKFLEDNILCFKEEEINSNSLLKETIEKQKREVEVDKEDIVKILNSIEGVRENKPLMIINSFELTKAKNKSFILENLGFIKMEFF
jgi:hypothetical protein